MISKFSGSFMAGFSALSMLALSAVVLSPQARADEWDKKTVLTINEPIQINKIYLPPGTYVLKLLDSESDRHIVRIMNADETHLIGTELAIPNYRLQPTGKTRFQFWETPAGSVKALRAPAASPQPAEPAPAPVASAPAPAPESAPAPAPATSAMNDQPSPPPAPQPSAAPAELPQTATPFPLFGLTGLLAAIGYSVIRWRRA
jgi:outer membrane biosynthesis protein TonB